MSNEFEECESASVVDVGSALLACAAPSVVVVVEMLLSVVDQGLAQAGALPVGADCFVLVECWSHVWDSMFLLTPARYGSINLIHGVVW